MDFEESGLHFSFGEGWAVKKYDTHRFYKGLSGAGLKGVDFIAIHKEGLFLMEVKNLRRRASWHTEDPMEAVWAGPGSFARRIAYKFEDTFLAIDAIWKYYNRKWIFRAVLPLLSRMQPTTRDWPFWSQAYQLSQAPSHVQLVLWIEMEQYPTAFLEEVEKEIILQVGERAGSIQIAWRGKCDLPGSFRVDLVGGVSG